MNKPTAIVIGAGVGGLAAAIRLATSGYKTTVIEANPFVGGKINSKDFGPYRFDMGPSVFTGPEYIQELYDLCNEDFKDFPYQGLDHIFTYTWPDGSRLVLPKEPKALVQTMAGFFGEDPRVIETYLAKAAKNYEAITPVFIEGSLHRLSHIRWGNIAKAFTRLPAYHLLETMHQENAKTFTNPKTVQFFDRYATYNGSDPYQAPAMLNMISHLELNVGPFMPQEGMVQIPQRLHALALRQGVEFRMNTTVDSIVIKDGRVAGVTMGKDFESAHVVFSNMDVAKTWKELLPQERHPQKTLDQEQSSSAVVFYWGIKKSFTQLELHNMFFGQDYKQEFDAIFNQGTLVDDPSIYINITSKTVPSDAPPGCENWFVMVNAPTNKGQDWTKLVAKLRGDLIAKLSRLLGEDIGALIQVEDVMDPPLIEKKYRGVHGSIYGIASNSPSSAFNRHPNFAKSIPGLYFVGVTIHPGGGIPLAINSAKIAMACLEEDILRGKLPNLE